MASITLLNCGSGETIPVEDIDLESVTPNELFEAVVETGVLPPPLEGSGYTCVNKEGSPLFYDEMEKAFLELGFCDGDTIIVLGCGLEA